MEPIFESSSEIPPKSKLSTSTEQIKVNIVAVEKNVTINIYKTRLSRVKGCNEISVQGQSITIFHRRERITR